MWEIYALTIIDELKTRASLKRLSELELDILYARAKTRLWEKIDRLRAFRGSTSATLERGGVTAFCGKSTL